MNLTLKRKDFTKDGIFGELLDEQGRAIAQTLEHSYKKDQLYLPKVPTGVFTCVRGPHRLHSGPIETFEIKGVEGHSGILFHYGNRQDDSEGCVLLGATRVGDMVTSSQKTFKKFMDLQSGVNEFSLIVR